MTSRDKEADRTPNWNKWRLIPNPALWQCVALSLNIDPDKVRTDRKSPMALCATFNESQEFRNRLDVARANAGKDRALRPTDHASYPQNYSVSLRAFAAWVQKIGWEAPAELLAMADEQGAINNDSTLSEKRTTAATLKRAAGKQDRLEDLRRFIDDVYTALERNGHALRDNNGRKPLPVSVEDLRTLFLVRHPDHKVARSTFDDDLGRIATGQTRP